MYNITLLNSFTLIIISECIMNISLDTIFFCNLSSTITQNSNNSLLYQSCLINLILFTEKLLSCEAPCLISLTLWQISSHVDVDYICHHAVDADTVGGQLDTDTVGGHLKETFIGSEIYSLCLQFYLYHFHVKIIISLW